MAVFLFSEVLLQQTLCHRDLEFTHLINKDSLNSNYARPCAYLNMKITRFVFPKEFVVWGELVIGFGFDLVLLLLLRLLQVKVSLGGRLPQL